MYPMGSSTCMRNEVYVKVVVLEGNDVMIRFDGQEGRILVVVGMYLGSGWRKDGNQMRW